LGCGGSVVVYVFWNCRNLPIVAAFYPLFLNFDEE